MRLHPSADVLKREVEQYLQHLGHAVPASTHTSHKATLKQFTAWYSNHQPPVRLDEAAITAYAKDHITDAQPTTTRGHIDTLANFFAYRWQDDPAVIKTRVGTHLANAAGTNTQNNRLTQLIPLLHQPNPTATDAVESLIQYLQQRHYATRTHAFVELLLDTRSPPTVLQECNQEDFDRDTGTIKLGIANTHTVTTAGLLSTRIASLTESTVDVLIEYLDYERKTVSGTRPSPMFTTARGRVSTATIRRSIKTASNTATKLANRPESTADPHVTPTDLWAYALHNNPDNQ